MIDKAEITEVALEKLQLAARQCTSMRLLREVKSHAFFDNISSMLCMEITAYVLGKRHHQVREYKWPSDWKEAFKARWFPAWAKRRWPVRHDRVSVDALELYPELALALPQDQHRATIVLSDRHWWRSEEGDA